MTDTPHRLAGLVRSGIRWAAGAHYVGMAVRLGVAVALARLLGPADFGVMALAMAVVGVLMLVQESGLGAALVQHRGRLEPAAGAALALATSGGVVAAMAVVVAAPALAAVLQDPRLEPVLRVLAASCILRGVGQAPRALLQRTMAFRTLALIELGGTVIYGAVALALARRGVGLWSLAAAQLASEAWLATAAIVSCAPCPVPWRADLATARELLGFGRPVMLANLFSLLHTQLPTFVAGRVLGAGPLGLYAMAQRWASLPVQGITHVAARVAYPALARLRDDGDRLAAAWLRVFGLVMALAVPAAMGLAVVAEPLVRSLYDDRWQAAVSALQVLAFYGLFHSGAAATGEVMKAAGAPRWVALYGLLYVVLLAAGLLGLASTGITGIATALTAASAVVMIASVATAARLVGAPPRAVAAAIGAPLAASAVLAAVALAARSLVRAAGGQPALELAVGVVAGALSYAGALAVVAPGALGELRALLGLGVVARDPGRMGVRPRRLGAAAIALAAALVAGEIGLRLTARGVSRGTFQAWSERRAWEALRALGPGDAPWPVPEGHAAWRLQPWARRIDYRLDSDGFRVDGATPCTTPPACTVAVVGDATVFGYGVAAGDALPAQLGARLPGARVDNGGLCGSNVAHQRPWLETVLARREPDVVALVVTPWSLRRDPAPAPASGAGAGWLKHLARWSAVVERTGWYATHLAGRRFGWPDGSAVAWELEPLLESDDAFAARWRGVAAELDAMVARATAAGARVVVAFVPLDVQVSAARNRLYREAELPYPTHGFVDRDYARDERHRHAVASWAAARGVELLDATDVLRADADTAFLPDDYHLSAAGHREVAAALASLVTSACLTGIVPGVAPAGAATRRAPVAAPAPQVRTRTTREGRS